MYRLLEVKDPAKVFEYNGFWLDIGRPSDYELATQKINDPDFTI
jgi:NDP-sugar pyrophosphorylase family protein